MVLGIMTFTDSHGRKKMRWAIEETMGRVLDVLSLECPDFDTLKIFDGPLTSEMTRKLLTQAPENEIVREEVSY